MKILPNLYGFEDTCNVYIVRSGREAVLVDFGSGAVMDHLERFGVERVTDVLMTHHHRDQGQGLSRAVAAGARVWVPHMEQDLFWNVDAHWQGRQLENNYNLRQDRFSLLEPVPVAGTLRDYADYRFGAHTFTVVPTPGHTPGSITLMAEVEGQQVAFSGDLISAPGKIWSLAATQWAYSGAESGAEGVAATIASLLDLRERAPALLLPSHGEVIAEPDEAIDLLVERLRQLLHFRNQNLRLLAFRERPYEALTPHLLLNRTSMANSYVLLSESGKALLIDYGYDFQIGTAAGTDRAARRPWLYTLGTLKRQYGVRKIDVALPTHHHDDHIAGFNLLREIEGTAIWAAENFAAILERPSHYDLPCLWYDPIPVDRVLPLEEPIRWEEYEFTLHDLPGHTRYAVAVSFEVDGKRVLAAGDQYHSPDGMQPNYIYQNRFRIEDYRHSAELYRRILPDLILTGHWGALSTEGVAESYLNSLRERGEALERLHRELLPLESVDFDAAGVGVRILPYQSAVRGGEPVALEVEVRNPYPHSEEAVVRLIAPPGWEVEEEEVHIPLAARATGSVTVQVRPPAGLTTRRARVAVDLMVGDRRFGQQAEALVTVTD